ncbi:MAG: hypothetical protein AAGH89_05030 [Verrucomicrobiota bacterium]
MSKPLFHSAVLLGAILIVACSDEKPVADQAPAPVTESPAPETTEERSLFAPVDAEHQKSMEERKEEAAEIERRIEAAAKVQEAEFLAEVKAKLVEYKAHYVSQYAEQIQPSVDQYQSDLTSKYLESLKQNYDAAQAGGLTVLAQQIAEEGKRVKAGDPVPRPPAESDLANPGMQILFDLRKWYHDGAASIGQSQKSSEAALTEAYRNTLQEYHSYVSQISPPEAGEAVMTALNGVSGQWWTAE